MKTEVKKIVVLLSIYLGFTCVNGMMLWMNKSAWIAENMFEKYVHECEARNGHYKSVTPPAEDLPFPDHFYGKCECKPGYVATAYYKDGEYSGEGCSPVSAEE